MQGFVRKEKQIFFPFLPPIQLLHEPIIVVVLKTKQAKKMEEMGKNFHLFHKNRKKNKTVSQESFVTFVMYFYLNQLLVYIVVQYISLVLVFPETTLHQEGFPLLLIFYCQ